jgi:hypothetical protein
LRLGPASCFTEDRQSNGGPLSADAFSIDDAISDRVARTLTESAEKSRRSHAESDAVAKLAGEIAGLMAENRREAALRHAMAESVELLRKPSRVLRFDLRRRVFTKLRGIGYQSSDFEAIDYLQYELVPDLQLPLFRGPAVPEEALGSGNYFCVIGAAQTFGRLVHRPWSTLLSEAIGLPVLNLSRGGGGPEFFLNPKLIDRVRRARFVILQAMSGRSVGCDEYPGGRRIIRDSKTTNVHRWDVLESLWQKDPAVALEYVRRWNASYVDLYRQLRTAIHRPTLLLWISERKPDDWRPERLLKKLDWGRFPQLVGRELFDTVADLFGERPEHVFQPSTEQPVSRVTGKPCPFFWTDKNLHSQFGYYPSSQANIAIADDLLPWARRVLA